MKWILTVACLIFAFQPAVAQLQFTEEPVLYFAGLRSGQMTSADINRDGHTDLLVINQVSDDVTLFINDGEGDFSEKISLPLPGGRVSPLCIGVGDLNADDIPDIVMGRGEFINNPADPITNSEAIIMIGREDGTYVSEFRPLSGVPAVVVFSDYDGDDDIDLVLGTKGLLDFVNFEIIDPGLSVFDNEGDGTLGPERYVSNDFGELSGLVPATFDDSGDVGFIGLSQGNLDLISGSLTDPNMHFYRNELLGLRSVGSITLDLIPNAVRVTDFNADGLSDFAITILGQQSDLINFSGEDASVRIFQNNGFDYDQIQTVPTDGITYALELADFDLDGDLDLATTIEIISPLGGKRPQLVLYENQGDFNFLQSTVFDVVDLPRYTVQGDFDSDGDIDLAVACTVSDSLDAAVGGFVYVMENSAITSVPSWELY